MRTSGLVGSLSVNRSKQSGNHPSRRILAISIAAIISKRANALGQCTTETALTALRQVDQLIRGHTGVSFRFIRW